MLRCLYVDLDGTLLGPDASLVSGADGRFSLLGPRALEACARAGVEVVIYSGRRQSSVWEAARLIGSRAFIFELGCGLVLDGELEWLTDGLEPSPTAGTIFEQIEASGAVSLLLERFAGSLEPHTPWSAGRDVSHLFRGSVSLDEVSAVLAAAGVGDRFRLLDNGVIHEAAALGLMPGLDVVRAYHLVPAGASKGRAVARHMQNRGYAPAECIACGDSREDLSAAGVVGTFWLVANALERDPGLAAEIGERGDVRVCAEGYGAGVYEAVVTTLAQNR
jgi:hydroxymethylpyrimidine pyrophosphatase-like HAD family hydrolase